MFSPLTKIFRWGAYLSLGSLLACAKAPEPPAVYRPVQGFTVSQPGTESAQVFAGEIRSRTETVLSFRTGGKLQERFVRVGDRVQSGQLLAKLDVQDNQLSLDAAAAQATLAENEFQRYQALRAKNFISQATLDAKEAAAKSARAQAGLAGHQRDYTGLYASHAGVIASIQVEEGQVLAAGQAVLRLARDDQPEAVIQVSEQQVVGLKKGTGVTLTPWVDPQQTWTGKIREISAVAELPARTFGVRISLNPPLPEKLRLGQSVTVNLVASGATLGAGSSGITVPLSAIFQRDGAAAVWTLIRSDSSPSGEPLATVKLQPVQVLAWQEKTALIAGSLKPGDEVVRAGVHKLTEGETVRVAQP